MKKSSGGRGRAGNRCSERCMLGFDFDLTDVFFDSLYAAGVLTRRRIQITKMDQLSSRESKVVQLLQILPQRGPEAFEIFKKKIAREFPWLAKKMTTELEKLGGMPDSINKRLIPLQVQLKLKNKRADKTRQNKTKIKKQKQSINKLQNQIRELKLEVSYKRAERINMF